MLPTNIQKETIEKEIPYSNRVLIGNWFEAAKLEEYRLNKFLDQMKKGDLTLARYRKMTENLNKPTVLTQATGSINFGSRISLRAPYVPATDSLESDKKGLILGGRLTTDDIQYSQDLEDRCSVVGHPDDSPTEKSSFTITSGDYCNRDNETVKYNQEFLLALSSSVAKKKSLYLRYDRDAFPGLNGKYPLYLSKHPVSNTRWRFLPVQKPNITRFELEGTNVHVNTDLIVNHCATNVNLGIHIGSWTLGFYGKICAPLMQTCLDIFGRELDNNIWQIYIPLPT